MNKLSVGDKVKLESYTEYSDYKRHHGQTAIVVDIGVESSRGLSIRIEWNDGTTSLVNPNNTKIGEEMAKKETEDKKVHLAEVVRHGEQLIIPNGMGIPDAIALLERRSKYEEEKIEIREKIDAFIWDGALALSKAMARKFGYANAETIPGRFFQPDEKPKMVSVEIGFNKTALVPWGRFTLPAVDGYVETSYDKKDGRIVFAINAVVNRKFESTIRELIALTREIADKESIYRNQALRLRFKDDNGNDEQMPMPHFLDLSRVKENELIFSKDVQNAIATSIFTPVEQSKECREYKIPLKRGILLSGPYGTGKTLVSHVTAKKCTDNAWTFLYCERANELGEMVRFAKHFEPAVIFCEDIDREVTGERSVEMDDILNIVDGIESKNSEIMIILTTNHIENINKAMLRPGRLDAIINVLPPDSDAVQKLVRLYGGKSVDASEDLKEVGHLLQGNIPAVIRECVERSKLSAIKNTVGSVNGNLKITAENLIEAAHTMKLQLDLLNAKKAEVTPEHALGAELSNMITSISEKVMGEGANRIIDRMEELHD